jgi:hypothetical protein
MISALKSGSTDFAEITKPHLTYHSRLSAVKSLAEDLNPELEETVELQEKFLRKFGSNSSAIVAISSGYFGFLRALNSAGSKEEFKFPAYLTELRAQDRSKNLAGNSNRLDSFKSFERESATVEKESPIAVAINWAISLGGDTRSNACIAGALAGSFWGSDEIPSEWLMYCEGTSEVTDLADRLFSSS